MFTKSYSFGKLLFGPWPQLSMRPAGVVPVIVSSQWRNLQLGAQQSSWSTGSGVGVIFVIKYPPWAQPHIITRFIFLCRAQVMGRAQAAALLPFCSLLCLCSEGGPRQHTAAMSQWRLCQLRESWHLAMTARRIVATPKAEVIPMVTAEDSCNWTAVALVLRQWGLLVMSRVWRLRSQHGA